MFQLPDDVRNRIQRIYTENPLSNQSHIELEARFGYFSDEGNFLTVGVNVFNRILSFFQQNVEPIITRSTDYSSGKFRKTLTDPQSPTGRSRETWIVKDDIYKTDVIDYGIRLSMNKEKPIHPIQNFTPRTIRIKNRTSFILYGKKSLAPEDRNNINNGDIRLDLTVVSMQIDNRDVVRYEIELELLNRRRLDLFQNAMLQILKEIQDTTIVYSYPLQYKVISYLNGLLNVKSTNGVNYTVLTQARNLHAHDLVYGGLVGNPQTSYTVTPKADGIRKLLLFSPDGVWLIMPPFELNLISRSTYPDFTGTVFDGELVPLERRIMENGAPTTKYWYLVFDCLCDNGDLSVQNRHHGLRMEKAQFVSNKIKNTTPTANPQNAIAQLSKILAFDTKDFREIRSPAQFFDLMTLTLSKLDTLPYKNDGLMFTPENVPYQTNLDLENLEKRTLSTIPDIVKWKPVKDMTIDFEIRWVAVEPTNDNPLGRVIHLYSSSRHGSVLFKGSRVFPFPPISQENTASTEQKMGVDFKNEKTLNAPTGAIFEYRWDENRKIFIPNRPRPDKLRANSLSVALDNWAWIGDPISKVLLQGRTFDLTFKYHNRIKRSLFQALQPEGKILLDIGSGQGGDSAKWRGFNKIIAIEPNMKYIPELQNRIRKLDMENKVLIVNTGGENYTSITEEINKFLGSENKTGLVDCISIMLSLTFFWENQETLYGLAQTIYYNLKPGGEIIFMTMDGNAVWQSFQPAIRGSDLTELIFENFYPRPATIKLLPPAGKRNVAEGAISPQSLYIDLPGTIVQQQTEYLVFINDLIILLRQLSEKRAWTMEETFRADQEQFLTNSELIFTKMYSYGLIKRDNNDFPKEMSRNKTIQVESESESEEVSEEESEEEISEPKGKEKTSPRSPRPTEETLGGKLPFIAVSPPNNPDDVVQKIECLWYTENPVIRIACIGDGSCFFHSTLKAYNKEYQENSDYEFRVDFSAKLRRDFAALLQLPVISDKTKVDKLTRERRDRLQYLIPADPKLPLEPSVDKYKTVYETAVNGAFVSFYEQQVEARETGSESPYKDPQGLPVEWSLKGLQEFFNSERFVGDETYGYIADYLGIDIYIVTAYRNDLRPIYTTAQLDKSDRIPRYCIVISGNGVHFEVIGVKVQEGYQTFFHPEDPFIVALNNQIKL